LLVPGLLFGIGVLLFITHWPPLGLIFLIFTIFIPINGPSGSNATMVLVAGLLTLWLLDMMTYRREIKLPPSLPIRPLLSLVLIASLAFGVGQLPWYTFAQPAPLGAQLGGLSIFILSAGTFLLVAYYVRDIRWLEWLTWVFLALGGVYMIGRLVPGLNRFAAILAGDSATGSLFWTWLVALSFSQAVFNRSLHRVWRVVIGGITAMTLYVAVTQAWAWNSGWLPAFVSLAAVLWVAKPKLGILFAFVGVAGAVIKLQKLISAIMVGDNEYSLGTRLDAWAIVWEITKVNPILGLGPANYHWYTPLFPIRGYAVRFNSHSQYIDLIAQTGFLGLICFFWFFGATAWLGWQLRQRVPDGFARAYVYGALGGLAGTLAAGALGDWVLPFFYNIGMSGFRVSMLAWLFLGGLVALEQMYVSRQTKI
jgi:O-antigen ligase